MVTPDPPYTAEKADKVIWKHFQKYLKNLMVHRANIKLFLIYKQNSLQMFC